MTRQEVILSACAGEITGAANVGRATSTPSIQVHDLHSSGSLASFKSSVSALHSVAYVESRNGSGGTLFAVQEGKALVHVWAWQKDQIHLKLHLPEKLTCFGVSPNGCWAAGGSANGQIYLWNLGSGLLVASFNAHYRTVTSVTFSADSHMLISASQDASVHIFLVSQLVDEEDSGKSGKPCGSLNDHTLGIRVVALGKTAGSAGGRCWTASDDGTIKMWSLYPPFSLLATFALPPSAIPSSLAVDPTERFLYIGTTQGDVYHVPLYRRRQAPAGQPDQVEAVGEGYGNVKVEGSTISTGSAVTCLELSLSSSHLLVGTHGGDIHIHSLPSLQHLRTISSHSGPITHLSPMLRPPDLIGSSSKSDAWPIMDIKPLERMRTRSPRDVQEVSILLRPNQATSRIDSLRTSNPPSIVSTSGSDGPRAREAEATLVQENKKLRAALDRAVKINEHMWNGIVDMQLVPPVVNGDSNP